MLLQILLVRCYAVKFIPLAYYDPGKGCFVPKFTNSQALANYCLCPGYIADTAAISPSATTYCPCLFDTIPATAPKNRRITSIRAEQEYLGLASGLCPMHGILPAGAHLFR